MFYCWNVYWLTFLASSGSWQWKFYCMTVCTVDTEVSLYFNLTQSPVKTVKPVKESSVKQINSLERNTNLNPDFLEQTLYSIYIIII